MLYSNTTTLVACATGHDWQFVKWAKVEWCALIVCRRCAESCWAGDTPNTANSPHMFTHFDPEIGWHDHVLYWTDGPDHNHLKVPLT